MKDVAIVFWSGTGNTEKMAELVAEGVKKAGGEPHTYSPSQFTPEEAEKYSAIAFGCPAMGDEILEEDEFQPMYNSIRPLLSDKNAGLFGSYGWGDGEWMREWNDDCAAAGCQLVSEPVIANYEPDDDATAACIGLGEALVNIQA